MTVLETAVFSKLDDQQIFEFFHHCLNSLSGDNLLGVKEQRWDNQEFEPLKKLANQFYLQRTLDCSFPVPPEFPERAQNALEAVFKVHKKDIICAIATKQLAANGHNLMCNFDWKLKWILGSSKLDSIKEPVCQVDFNCTKLLGEDQLQIKKNVVNFECNLEKLDELLVVLSKAKIELKKEIK